MEVSQARSGKKSGISTDFIIATMVVVAAVCTLASHPHTEAQPQSTPTNAPTTQKTSAPILTPLNN